MRNRTRRLIILALFLVLLYWERRVLSPFILALVVSYVLSPLISLLHQKLKIPRALTMALVYLSLILLLSLSFFTLTSRLLEEGRELSQDSASLISSARLQLLGYPDWAKSLVLESIHSLQNASLFAPTRIFPFFSGAISQVINLILFLTTTFYLLKDGEKIHSKIQKILLETLGEDFEGVLGRISNSFSLFLRGQLFLVLLMSSLTFLVLAFLNVKFALILAIFTGFAEIVPIVGPVVATIIATVVSVTDGRGFWGLDPIGQGATIVAIYFVLRQLEDVVVIPHVMGKITRVHPLLVMFSVLAAGHLYGFWGLFLAVPLLSTLKILLEYYW